MPNVTRVCHQCGKSYRTHDQQRPKYCSQACYGLSCRRGEPVPCRQCGAAFYRHASRPARLYCSISCALTARNLTDANPSYHRDISGAKNPMHGKGMKGEANPMFGVRKERAPRWNGGRRVRRDGYVIVVAPDDHPYPCEVKKSGLKCILEHRLIMEKHLGRYLEPEEVVHHRDGNPSNNDLENLQLFASQSEHMSQAH